MNISGKYWLRCVVLGCIGVCLLPGCRRSEEISAPESPAVEQAVADMAVSVNGAVLTRSELNRRITERLAVNAELVKGLGPDAKAKMEKDLRKSVVDNFVHTTLLMVEAKSRDIDVSDSEIDQRMDLMRSRIPSGKTFEELLARMETTEEALRARIRREMTMAKLRREVESARSEVTEDEIRGYYDAEKPRYQIEPETAVGRHIFAGCQEGADQSVIAAKRDMAEGWRTKLLAGADFASLAVNSSEDIVTKDKGGNLGAVKRGSMVTELDKALFSQEINAIGPVIETPQGFHIVQVLRRSPAMYLSLEQVREQIKHTIATTRRSRGFTVFVEELIAGADIVYGDMN